MRSIHTEYEVVCDASGRPIEMVGTVQDITERKRAEERLVYMAHYDQLTGLTNRTLLQDRLKQALVRSDRSGGKVAFLYLDLDRFKTINDTLGHASGDETLKVVAKRIKARLRESDTAARMGGDEFAIILEDLSDAQDAALVARDLIDLLSESIALAGNEILVSASIGIAIYPPSPRDSMLQHADAAMYHAKKGGRNNYRFYTEEMNALALERLRLESNLSHALDREEFELYYQPQVNLATGKIVGAEALLRWRHPDLGMVFPAKFIHPRVGGHGHDRGRGRVGPQDGLPPDQRLGAERSASPAGGSQHLDPSIRPWRSRGDRASYTRGE